MGQALRRASAVFGDGNVEGVATISATGGGDTSKDAIENSKVVQEENERQGVPAPATSRSTSASIPLMKVLNWDGKSEDITQQLAAAFQAKDYLDCIKNLKTQNVDPPSYINNLDKFIGTLETDSELRRQCIRALSGLSKSSTQPVASSVSHDFWRLADEKYPDKVFAAKSLRAWRGGPTEKVKEKYWKEVVVSKRMSHPNILSIEGVAPEMFEFCMISQWMENGNVLEYVGKHAEVDRLPLLIGVVHGLSYLHDNGIIHGDLKSPNILVDAEGNPRLQDFANCSFMDNTDPVDVLAPSYTYTIRWSAPERLGVNDQAQEPTKMSDIYALSMVIVELATGRVPFPEFTDQNVIVMVAGGKRPSKPDPFEAPGITPEVWKIAQKCWNEKENERPEVDAVLKMLESLPKSDGANTQDSFFQRWRRYYYS